MSLSILLFLMKAGVFIYLPHMSLSILLFLMKEEYLYIYLT